MAAEQKTKLNLVLPFLCQYRMEEKFFKSTDSDIPPDSRSKIIGRC